MDSNSKKILKFLCKNKHNYYSLIFLSQKFPEISKDHIVEIIHELHINKFIKYVNDYSIKITNKGITYFSLVRSNWLSEHIIETIALILSLIAIIISIIALVISS